MSPAIAHPERIRLPDLRPSLTQKVRVCGYKCYVTVSFFDDHPADRTKPAEVFVKVAKQGSMVAGLMDGVCVLISVALQHGIKWDVLRAKLEHHVFERKEDEAHTSLLDGLAKAVDAIIRTRTDTVGEPDALAAPALPANVIVRHCPLCDQAVPITADRKAYAAHRTQGAQMCAGGSAPIFIVNGIPKAGKQGGPFVRFDYDPSRLKYEAVYEDGSRLTWDRSEPYQMNWEDC